MRGYIFLHSILLVFGLMLVPLVSGHLSSHAVAGSAEGSLEKSYKVISAQSVVELFTSQGCSSCPPADANLENYIKRDDVIALSYAVDYWDYLGWRDTYGRAENSKRQRAYANARGDGSVYTPQAVVNGVAHMNGASKSLIDRQILNSRDKLDFVKLKAAEYQSKIRISGTGQYNMREPLVLWMVRVKDKGTVSIERGENHGRKISYHNVVLGVEKVGNFGKDGIVVDVDRKKALPLSGEHCIFIVQVGSSGPVLGALEIK